MAIQFGNNRNVAQQSKPVTRNVTPAKSVTRNVTQMASIPEHISRREEQHDVRRYEFDALKAEVAALRELIARQAVEPSSNKRAAYMREYRKRPKGESR